MLVANSPQKLKLKKSNKIINNKKKMLVANSPQKLNLKEEKKT